MVVWCVALIYCQIEIFVRIAQASPDSLSVLCVFLGMDEALEHLERLNEYNFHIPEDLAIRHLTKINDAFGDT